MLCQDAFIFKFVISPMNKTISKISLTKEATNCNLVLEVKWRHCANGSLRRKLLPPSIQFASFFFFSFFLLLLFRDWNHNGQCHRLSTHYLSLLAALIMHSHTYKMAQVWIYHRLSSVSVAVPPPPPPQKRKKPFLLSGGGQGTLNLGHRPSRIRQHMFMWDLWHEIYFISRQRILGLRGGQDIAE